MCDEENWRLVLYDAHLFIRQLQVQKCDFIQIKTQPNIDQYKTVAVLLCSKHKLKIFSQNNSFMK